MILKPTSAIRHRWTMSSRRYSLDVRRRLLVLLALLFLPLWERLISPGAVVPAQAARPVEPAGRAGDVPRVR